MDKGHIVFCDRYYSSVPLAETLASRGTGYVGTLVRNRKDLPKEVRGKNFKLRSDEIKAWRHEKKLVGWRNNNKKPVLMLATTSSSAPTSVLAGRRRQSVTKPQVIVDYNNAMDGVDRADQYCVYYSFHRKTVKCGKRFCSGLLKWES